MESAAARQAREKVGNPGTAGTAAPPPSTPSKASAATVARPIGYGMPCANCRAYYPADMQACPICRAKERVSATAVVQVPDSQTPAQPDQAKLLAEERERLRELKSQIYASHPQMATSTFRCALDQNHDSDVEPAAVCHSCYSTARQRADRMEAALQIDTQTAAKIVYEAVWADTSDPNKTYLNAANALLGELRERAGVGLASRPKPAAH
jgi:glycine/D-amino acid oxidase-like deaminating enzyme